MEVALMLVLLGKIRIHNNLKSSNLT